MKLYASISYDGSFFKGIAIQPNQPTVKGCFDDVLSRFFNQKISMQLVSRTDKGVHAMDSRICFEVETKIPTQKLSKILNAKLSKVRLNWVTEVNASFELHKQPLSKEYMYQISLKELFPFQESYMWHLEESCFQGDGLQDILELFVGEHNFRNFCKVDHTRNITNFNRLIEAVSFEYSAGILKIFIRGNGFLWMMVRYIVYAVVACMKEQLTKENITRLLKGEIPAKTDLKYLRPAPAEGLYLYKTLDTNGLSL